MIELSHSSSADSLQSSSQKPKREPGGWKGRIWIAPDFDETTPEIIEMFYGDYDKDLF